MSKYFRVPVNDGVLDIDYLYLIEGVQTSEAVCYVNVRDDVSKRDSWEEVTEVDFLQAKEMIGIDI